MFLHSLGKDRKMLDTNTDYTANQRLTNIELLRIIAMVIIIAHHLAYHSGFDFIGEGRITINRLWIKWLESGGKIGVDIFVLITGFFLVKSNAVKTKKVVKMWLQVLTWSVTFYVVFILTGIETFSIRTLFENCLPIIHGKWWFASCYFMLYLLSPFISKLLNTMEKKEYISLLVFLGICWCGIPTIIGQTVESNDLLWFIFLYSVGGYIRLYDIKTNHTGIQLIWYSMIVWIVTFFISFISPYLVSKIPLLNCFKNLFGPQSVPTVVISILLFLGFKTLDIKYNRIINSLASATFGIYLIHDNSYVRPFIWKNVFQNSVIATNSIVIMSSIMEIIVVFFICSILELIRIRIIEKVYMQTINSTSQIIDSKINSMINKLVDM